MGDQSEYVLVQGASQGDVELMAFVVVQHFGLHSMRRHKKTIKPHTQW